MGDLRRWASGLAVTLRASRQTARRGTLVVTPSAQAIHSTNRLPLRRSHGPSPSPRRRPPLRRPTRRTPTDLSSPCRGRTRSVPSASTNGRDGAFLPYVLYPTAAPTSGTFTKTSTAATAGDPLGDASYTPMASSAGASDDSRCCSSSASVRCSSRGRCSVRRQREGLPRLPPGLRRDLARGVPVGLRNNEFSHLDRDFGWAWGHDDEGRRLAGGTRAHGIALT